MTASATQPLTSAWRLVGRALLLASLFEAAVARRAIAASEEAVVKTTEVDLAAGGKPSGFEDWVLGTAAADSLQTATSAKGSSGSNLYLVASRVAQPSTKNCLLDCLHRRFRTGLHEGSNRGFQTGRHTNFRCSPRSCYAQRDSLG